MRVFDLTLPPNEIVWRRSLKGARLRHAFLDGATRSSGQMCTTFGPSDAPKVNDPDTDAMKPILRGTK